MYHVKIRRPDASDTLATGSGATWEEAAFHGYDQVIRPTGEPRRYLAYVESEPSPGRKIVRFGFRTPEGGSMKSDPVVAVDVERLD
jgi:hypothetical protein